MSWLDELKEGDSVHIYNGRSIYSAAAVERFTKTQIVTRTGKRERRFNRATLREVGYQEASIRAFDPVAEERRQAGILAHRIHRAIDSTSAWQTFAGVPLSALQQIEAILVEHGVLKEAQP